MELQRERFDVRLARTEEEIASAQRLRYRVFVEEMGAPAAAADHARRLEMDRFDPVFDHLIMIDLARPPADPLDRVVGAYRLMTGPRAASAGGFYSAAEYDLGPLAARRERLVELGRSCLAPEYRGGAALHMMWAGLAGYVLERRLEVLFGVASFHGTDPQTIAAALSYLHHNHLAPPDLRVRARPPGRVAMDILPPARVDRAAALAQTPSLIKAYLRLGGHVGEGAFVDHDFNTIDVCLLMDTARMVDRYRELYTRGATPA